MDLITLVVVLIILGLVWWLLSAYVLPKLSEPIRTIVIIILVLIAILFLLGLIGIGPGIRLR